MSVSSLESFEQLMIFPLPEDNAELNSLADLQIKYFLQKKKKKNYLRKANRKISDETSKQWLKKHTSKARVDELTTGDLELFHKWYVSTAAGFNNEDGVNPSRQLFRYLLHTICIFESKSHLNKFATMLDFKKRDQESITLPEFTSALTSCGVQDVTKFRDQVYSQQKKTVSIRQSKKLPLHMKANKLSSTSTYRKEGCPNNVKRMVTRTPLSGGGMMYVCCPDVSNFQSSQQAPRPNTAPAPGGPANSLPSSDAPSAVVPIPLLKQTSSTNRIGKLIRQKTSRLNVLEVEQDSILPSVAKSRPEPPGPKGSILSGLGSPESHLIDNQCNAIKPSDSHSPKKETTLAARLRKLQAISGREHTLIF
mmetsp:Transcript_35519/g.66302  ORF Transcript_35519/g.66302 Transcript_35519/m.66302 type:complete len:365 (-) Transcript_35519:231-1325(-)